jgi:hypothetical protein
MVENLAQAMTQAEIDKAVDGYVDIGVFLDNGLKQQTAFDLEAFEASAKRSLSLEERDIFMKVQHQANRWTYLGSGMTHKNFLETLGTISPAKRAMIEGIAPTFS